MEVLKRNNVKVFGKGDKYMMFAHGYGCDQNMWRYVAPSFYDEYKVVLFDHVGAGNSDVNAYSPAKYSNLNGYSDDVLEILKALRISKVTFVGHSVGAMVGVLAAIKEPARFEKMILVGPSPCYINKDDYIGGFSREDIEGLLGALESNYLGWSHTITPIIMGNPERPELTEELSNSFCRTNPEIAKHFARVTFLSDNRSDLKKLSTDCLILQCSQDIIAPFEVGNYLHKTIGSSQLVVLKATGHCPNLSAPKETIATMKSYLYLN